MKLVTREVLATAGYTNEPLVSEMLAEAAELAGRGIADPKYVLKLLRRRFGPPPPKAGLRDAPAPLAEALEATDPDAVENLHAVRRRMHALLRSPVIVRGAILPDACPAGPGEAALPVGGAIVAENAVIPSAHSSDICCSMSATFYDSSRTLSAEMDALAGVTRFGQGHRHPSEAVDDPVHDEDVWDNPFLTGLRERARLHMADQGDGNHFAFVGELAVTREMIAMLRLTGHKELAEAFVPHAGRTLRALVTHHGSRGLGANVFKRGQIAAMKHTAKLGTGIPDDAAWLDVRSGDGPAYLEALAYVARWTRANHRAIHRRFLATIGAVATTELHNEHNFVWQRGDLFYHGKGATPAWRDGRGRPLPGLIPLNMAEPVLIVLGADNQDFLSFAPHGAGRNISRTAMRRRFGRDAAREEIARTTRRLDVRWYCGKPDLAETPAAYKNAAEVKAQIARFGLAEVIGEIHPLGCIMAGEAPRREDVEELTPKQVRQIAHRAERRKARRDLRDEI